MKKTGIELIAQERQEHPEKHGRTIERDVAENPLGQLSEAAAGLLVNGEFPPHLSPDMIDPPENWDINWWRKTVSKSYKERLIIAGALIAAEIDRIQYHDPV